jgi:hypothetical protein
MDGGARSTLSQLVISIECSRYHPTPLGLSNVQPYLPFQTGYAADILSIATLALSKIVTCIFYESLFYQMQRRFIRSILILTVTWTIMSILLLAIRCDARPWTDISSEQCSGLVSREFSTVQNGCIGLTLQFRRWQAITALDVVTEVSLLVYSAMAMSQVKVSLHKKLLVILALGCRIVYVQSLPCPNQHRTEENPG